MADRIGCNRTEVCFFAMLIFIYSSFWCVRALDNNGFECPSSCICVGQEVECQQNPSENKVQQLSGTGSTSLKYEDKEDIPMLSRQRRNVAVEPSREPRPNRTNTPAGAALFPCDFEEDFCQWYHSSDSDFKWSRNKGATPSSATGPTTDHTSGAGWYIYTEASIPRRYGDRARLTSPTLAANNSDAICKMEFFVHMRGSDIGALNVYQAPVEGHDILKKSWSGHQGTEWFKGEVTFDSRETFQIIVEGVRGRQFRGDIALDDFVISSGCRRINPSYVRLVNGTAYNNGLVQVWRDRNWHQVCSTGWTTKNSDVGCRELGFIHAINSSLNYPLNMSAPVVYNVSCNASEDSVNECRISNITEPSQCSSSTSASVVCSGVADVCPSLTHLRCPADAQGVRKCISRGQLCDFHNDCWNGTDEMNCANYTRCSFEEGFCGWLQGNSAEMNWTRHRGNTPSRYTGPSADHNSNKDKYYLYIEVSGRQGKERARLGVAPRFQGNHAGLCKVRFWFHMLGLSIGTLRVYAIDKFSSQVIWSKSESRGNLWGRAEVTLLNTSNSFQVIFEAEHIGYNYQGDIAIDDVSFTPECRPAPHEIANCSAGNFPCNSGECVPLDKLCDFSDDCFDASDELNCGENSQGRCNFDENFCGWTNPTNDDFDWTRRVGETPTYLTGPPYDHTHGFGGGGYYIYIEASYPRQRNDKAQLLSPQFMLSDVKNCKMRFFYHMYGSWISVGTLNVKLLNTITGATRPLWHMSGNRGKSWHQAEVVLDTSWPVVQVMFEGHRGLGYQSDIAIDDVSFSPECYPPEAIHVLKNYDIRLADGGSSNEGRVEIFRVGQWGTVCTDEWDRKEADVVCGQLGYSQARVVSHSFGPGSGQIWLDNLACFGNESKLYECPHNGWAKHDCTHRQDAGVICNLNGARKAVRLAGNRKHSRHGRVEIFHNNEWSSICIDGWDLHDGHVACTQLGFSGIDKITKEPLDPNSKAVLTNMGCHGNETSLDKCEPLDWGDFTCLEDGSAGVECKDKDATDGNIRLVGGTSFSNGRVEIFYRGEWGTICEDKWIATNARVTCLQLGFTHVSKVYQSYGPGKGRIWMDQVNCNGNEASLADCPQRGWGVTDCFHSEDVGVICSDEGYVGCYIDRKPAAMMHISSSPVMTIVMCMRICQARGYQYAGLQWSSECHCANQSDKYGKAPDEECNTPCSGDYSKKCGGPWRLSVYNTNPAILPSTSPGYAAVRQSCERYIYSGFPGLYGVTRENSNYFAGDHRSGKIWSPNFPLNYPDLMKCVWVLNLYPDTKAHIEFEHFETESFHDRITIKDGKRNFDDNLTPRNGFSGHNASSVTASSNLMWIQFESDFSVNEKGFRLVYEARGVTTTAPVTTATPTMLPSTKYPKFQYISGGCDGIIDYNSTFGYHDKYHDSGYIKSPNYPYSYLANSECRWSIYVLKGFRVKVSVVALDIGSTGSSLDITDDYVTWHMDKKRNDLVFISKENYVKVTFVSTSNVSGEGFKIEYERFMMPGSPPISDEGGVGAMIGVVVGVVLALILIVGVLVAIKKKKQQRPHAVRHNFVNQAYDGVGDVNTPPATEPAVHYAVAPPPYSQITPVAVPVATAELTPVHEEGAAPKVPTYAQLYAIPVAPPVYEAGVVQATGATTTVTGLGSVTNVREGTAATSLPGTQPMTGNRRSVLPPIRGGLSGSASVGNEEKKPITGSEAGPLPQKVPLVVDTPAESRPSAPSQSMISVRSVSPPLSATDFDEEPPFEFFCPITNQMMSDPVTADDGKTYERNAIRSWLRRNPTSPITGNPLVDETLKVNHELKAKIEDFKRKHSKVVTL